MGNKIFKNFKFGIKTKVIGLFVLIILVIAVVTFSFVTYYIAKILRQETIGQTKALGNLMATQLVDYILIDDLVSANLLLEKAKSLKKNIIYIFVQTNDNKIFTHTFKNGFPADLKKITSYSQNSFLTEKGIVENIKVPILNKELGFINIGISMNYINNKVKYYAWLLVLFLGLTILFALSIALYLSGKYVNSLQSLTKAAIEVGKGNLNFKVHIQTNDEIETLSHCFNDMLEKIKSAEKKLVLFYEQAIQNEKLIAVGRFATGIAHEINNPIMGILNSVNRLQKNTELGIAEKKYLSLIKEGLERINKIANQTLEFAKSTESNIKVININKALEETIDFVQPEFSSKGTVILKEFLLLPDIKADEFQLKQVFLNIILNSFDSMSNGGYLTINTQVKTENKKEFICIKISDNGSGIKKEYLEKIFEPFFTTKQSKQGTGLGLFICYYIIKKHFGEIIVDSKENEGTTVTIILPVSSELYEQK